MCAGSAPRAPPRGRRVRVGPARKPSRIEWGDELEPQPGVGNQQSHNDNDHDGADKHQRRQPNQHGTKHSSHLHAEEYLAYETGEHHPEPN
ncbi:hypothetical protein XAP6164_1490021 [Xanthomonas phaseoli pv. phaseoli]|nr:hypothetical protein XAP6164_1490021 [Xanthomonas phaseoli pv. phaseoli]